MSTLYIDRRDSQLSVDAGVLSVAAPDAVKSRRIPLKYLERIVLRADTQLRSKDLCALADGGVNLIALSGRAGQRMAQISGVAHNDARRRWQQILALSQPEVCAQLALAIVRTKIRRQNATLRHVAAARSDLRKPLFDGQRGIAVVLQALQRAGQSLTLAQIRGYEGAAAAAYFAAYFTAFAPALGANGRNRRPPTDPVNAVLSLSYTLLHSQAHAACWAAGLDPALGALHTVSFGRAALACDLMEPLRPQVDLWVWQMFRQGELRSEHFGHDGAGACLLGKAGRAHFYQRWEQQNHYPRALRGYAGALSKALLGAAPAQAWDHLSAPSE